MALTTRDGLQVDESTDDVSIYLESDPGTVAHALRPLLTSVLGHRLPVLVELWDGSTIGPLQAPGVLRVRSRDALRRLLWAPDELGLSRAYVAGDLDIEGDVFEVLATLRDAVALDARLVLKLAPRAVAAARATGAFGLPLPPPPEEARPRGRRHSKARDAEVVSHHYDVGNDFYRLVLGPSMTYSCAKFADPRATLEEAQAAKHELVTRKLGLHERPGARLLDVGCGWGTMAMHAAAQHGASVVGITISKEQAARARQRVEEAGLTDRVEIREQDYRDLGNETFDAISSIGMFEHVGEARMAEYFAVLRRLLLPKGRLLNHAISSVGGSRLPRRSFTGRYVFPDGELLDVGRVCLAMEAAGFEVRDVESLREHYALTLRRWVANLEAGWDEIVRLVGERRARIWRLYMAGSAVGFEDGGVSIHQVLGVVPTPIGESGMPSSRDGWSAPGPR
jgi:cyclopropane-fatty-acyl-phospholipid synthase